MKKGPNRLALGGLLALSLAAFSAQSAFAGAPPGGPGGPGGPHGGDWIAPFGLGLLNALGQQTAPNPPPAPHRYYEGYPPPGAPYYGPPRGPGAYPPPYPPPY